MDKTRSTISVVIIAKNEAQLIVDCILSADFADEIIVLDSGSEDDTVEVAKQLGAKVYIDRHWEGFGKQRQKAQRYAKSDFILMVDADERISLPLKEAVLEVLHQTLPDDQVYAIARSNLFLGRYMKHSGWFPDYVVRLYKRTHFQYKDDMVHESLNCQPEQIKKIKGHFIHLTCRDLISFQKKQLEYAEAWANERILKGKNCHYFSIWSHTISAFIKTYLLKCGFLDGKQGLLLAFVNANYTFNKYTKLWVHQLGQHK